MLNEPEFMAFELRVFVPEDSPSCIPERIKGVKECVPPVLLVVGPGLGLRNLLGFP
jgi:hypothetical protein